MHRSIALVSVVALAVLGPGVGASAEPATAPLQGTISGQVDVAPAPDCPIGLMTVSDGEGDIAPLGRVVMHSEHCTPAGAHNPFGQMTFRAENGDSLTVIYNGFAPYPEPTDTVIGVQGDLLIVGGAGGFAGAMGGHLDTDWDEFSYVAELRVPGYLEDGNFPPGPFTTVWEFGPTDFDL